LPPLIIAHRGNSSERPENTKAAFVSALEVGAEIIELDVQLTGDGHIVVIHDDSLDRTTSGQGRVAERTLGEIRALSAGYPERFGDRFAGERVPTLGETLELLRGRARVMIEIKKESVTEDDTGGVEARVIEEVRRKRMAAEVALISFERRALLRARELAPEITRGHLFYRAEPTEVMAGAREVASDVVLPEKGMLSEQLRELTREAGMRVASWVVDDPEELSALDWFGLFGVGTNRPGALLEAIANQL
jgi:glycerophosphoryl diester phosphodiesterase